MEKKRSIEEIKWHLFNEKKHFLFYNSISTGAIRMYDDKLLETLREIPYQGVPASITLLTMGLTEGNYSNNALLLSRAFINTDDEISLVYGNINSLSLDPKLKGVEIEHCFLERKTKEGVELVYDTTTGLIYDKDTYYQLECPKVKRTYDKKTIKEYLRLEDGLFPELTCNSLMSLDNMPNIDDLDCRKDAIYSVEGMELLEREIRFFKDKMHEEKKQKVIKRKIIKMPEKAAVNF